MEEHNGFLLGPIRVLERQDDPGTLVPRWELCVIGQVQVARFHALGEVGVGDDDVALLAVLARDPGREDRYMEQVS